MKRAIDIIIDIHTKNEIERLKADIIRKCHQISELYGEEDIFFEEPKFFRRNGKKLTEIK